MFNKTRSETLSHVGIHLALLLGHAITLCLYQSECNCSDTLIVTSAGTGQPTNQPASTGGVGSDSALHCAHVTHSVISHTGRSPPTLTFPIHINLVIQLPHHTICAANLVINALKYIAYVNILDLIFCISKYNKLEAAICFQPLGSCHLLPAASRQLICSSSAPPVVVVSASRAQGATYCPTSQQQLHHSPYH